MTDTEWRATNRWRGVVGVVFAAGAVGLLAHRADVLLVGVVGVLFAAYPLVSPTPRPRLELERRVSERHLAHGEEVTVTVTLRNVGTGPLFDVRLVDGVPAALCVCRGSPRHGTALRPGEAVSYEYGVEARHGRHSFEPATALVRDPSGAREAELSLAAETETDIECASGSVDAVLRRQTMEFVGLVRSRTAGSGIEFHGIREFRPGDPINRIDWNRYARTGERTTVEHRRELAASVVLAVDAREPAYRGLPDQPHAVASCVAAAEQFARVLAEERTPTGLAGLGRAFCWVPSGVGVGHAGRLGHVLRTHPTFASRPPDQPGAPLADQVARLRKVIPGAAQVVLFSPLPDAEVVAASRTLEAYGHGVSVVSPDVTGDATTGQRLAALERHNHVSAHRRAGIPVADWNTARPLGTALERAGRGTGGYS